MLFNSNDFLIFLGIFLVLYWIVRRSLEARNTLIVLASYVFYGWWNYRFVGLLLLTSLVDYVAGLLLDRGTTPGMRRALVTISVFVNLMILGIFKYFDFFEESFRNLLAALGVDVPRWSLHLILPVGISFYTFQSMGYTIDVYRRRVPATRNLLQFLAYVSFFPQLVAGPIERSGHLLPQLRQTLKITTPDVERGLWLILWGMFKKVVIADQLAPIVGLVFDHPAPGLPLLLAGTTAFAVQIYCDFSGYTDIARGTARLLGFDLMLNFNLPYFATNIREFWQRWHISLSTWLRDYLYIPLGGNRGTAGRTYRNLFLTLLLGGLWHGAALNFLLWGLWHGAGLAVHRWWRGSFGQKTHVPAWLAWMLTMAFVWVGWMLFRAQSPGQLLEMASAFAHYTIPEWWWTYVWNLVVLSAPLVVMQICQHLTGDLEIALKLRVWLRATLQAALLFAIVLFWGENQAPFIYFQF